jgi:[acyl-carrier-protein] S-malonyltransferase
MKKIAFMFPGQGSFELGMGRDIAEAEPEAMAVYEQGSEASGLDLRELCFSGSAEDLTRTDLQQPALVATSLAISAARPRDRAGLRGRSLGRGVLGPRRSELPRSRRDDRPRA